MKKSAFPAALLLLGVTLSGCPVYDASDVGCYNDYDCAAGYLCDDRSGECVAEQPPASSACQRPRDCGTNETCSRFGTCLTGDCHFASVGCVRGYECSSSSGRWECVEQGPTGAGGADSGGQPALSTAGEPAMSSGGAPEAAAGTGG